MLRFLSNCLCSPHVHALTLDRLCPLYVTLLRCAARLFVMPPQAGGGSCATFSSRSVFACGGTVTCNSWVRNPNATHWLQGLSHNLGIKPAVDATTNVTTADLSDPSSASWQFPWKRFNAVSRSVLGWLSPPFVQDRGSQSLITLTSSSLLSVPAGAVGVVKEYSSTTTFWISLRTRELTTYDSQLHPGIVAVAAGAGAGAAGVVVVAATVHL